MSSQFCVSFGKQRQTSLARIFLNDQATGDAATTDAALWPMSRSGSVRSEFRISSRVEMLGCDVCTADKPVPLK